MEAECLLNFTFYSTKRQNLVRATLALAHYSMETGDAENIYTISHDIKFLGQNHLIVFYAQKNKFYF